MAEQNLIPFQQKNIRSQAEGDCKASFNTFISASRPLLFSIKQPTFARQKLIDSQK